MKSLFFILGLAFGANHPRAIGAQAIYQPPIKEFNFDIKAAPSSGDWQRFQMLTKSELQTLWTYHKIKKVLLKDWAWQWRLGWVRRCGGITESKWCETIIREGMADPALVVRAESAEQYSRLKTKTPMKARIQALATTYSDSRNFRNGKPLFICERILKALLNLNSLDARNTAARLAKGHRSTAKYWAALSASEKVSKKEGETTIF